MNIAISGASGFIGSHLTTYLTNLGHHVTPLKHSLFREQMEGELQQIISHSDVVINLAGASLNHRWTTAYQKELIESRIKTTRMLVKTINTASTKPKLLISVSAVGYYPDDGIIYDEYTAKKGQGFLSDLCQAWENEARKCSPETRLVITRLGVVLSLNGGAIQQLLKPLKMIRLGVAVAPGTQPMPWVDIKDVCQGMTFIIDHTDIEGVVNLVAPDLVSHYVFVRLLTITRKGLATIMIPQWVIRLMLGKGSVVLTQGQQVYPTKLLDMGYQFKSPTIKCFFKNINS